MTRPWTSGLYATLPMLLWAVLLFWFVVTRDTPYAVGAGTLLLWNAVDAAADRIIGAIESSR